MVVLDCAAYTATSPLDLSATPADFVCVSFYKMFGFPTGLGALVGMFFADGWCICMIHLGALVGVWMVGGVFVLYISGSPGGYIVGGRCTYLWPFHAE